MSFLTNVTNLPQEDKKMLNSVFRRSFMVFAGMAGLHYAAAPGYIISIWPALKRWYPDKESRAEALKRHSTWYNITQNVGTLAMGLSCSMEKENSLNRDTYDTSAIVSVKSALMGPMSGIGDSIFWGIVRTIAAGVGISMAANGSVIGPIMFLILYNVPSILCRYYMTYLGYSMGESFIKKMFESGLMEVFTKAAGIVGLMMVGCMTASNVSFATSLSIAVEGGEPIMIQTYFDQLFSGILPLSITLVCFWLLKKKNVNVNVLMIGIMIFSFACVLLGIC